MKLRCLQLIALKGIAELGKGSLDIIETFFTIDFAERGRIRGAAQFFHDGCSCEIRHFVRGQQRTFRLCGKGLGAAVVIEAAGGRAFLIEGKGRCRCQIADRWHRTRTELIQVRAAQLNGQRIRLRMRVVRMMAARARLFAGSRQRSIMKYQLT